MCGILGSFFKGSNKNLISAFENALSRMQSRGPDNQNFNHFDLGLDKFLLLGHVRLSIIDLSSAGHQPMFSNNKRYVLVFNGEIYNYKEIRYELADLGWEFISDSDTEVLLVAWQQWGPTCLPKLLGMFSFVIFDKENNTLTCVRDAFGIKPFFYAQDENSFQFASDVKSLNTLRRTKPTINWQRSYDYLVHADYDSNELTFFDGVKHLLPGSIMTFNLNTYVLDTPKTWWKPSVRECLNLNFTQATELVREQFLENIRIHLRSDVPLGVALSGGIDSSAVVCAIRYLEPNININTFSYIAKNNPLSEENWVDIVNNHVGAKAHKVIANGHDLIRDIDTLILAQGEPFGSTSIYAQYRVFQLAKETGITVALDGQGADELLAGYRGYPMQRMQSMIENRQFLKALNFANNWRKWPGRSNKDAIMLFLAANLPNNLRPLAKQLVMNPNKPKWINTSLLYEAGVSLHSSQISQSEEFRGRRVTETLSSTLQQSGLPELLRHADRNSMNFSIESRVPFLTIPFAELLLSLPEEYLISHNGETKSVFRAAMRGIVPDSILDRKDKIGFESPELEWLKETTPQLQKWLENSKNIPFLNPTALLDEFNAVMAGKKRFSWQVWRWINFVRWVHIMGLET